MQCYRLRRFVLFIIDYKQKMFTADNVLCTDNLKRKIRINDVTFEVASSLLLIPIGINIDSYDCLTHSLLVYLISNRCDVFFTFWDFIASVVKTLWCDAN